MVIAFGNGPATSVPIGSIVAWLKNRANTPALPWGWLECNGQAITYGVYAGSNTPSINNGRFLYGIDVPHALGGQDEHSHNFETTSSTTSSCMELMGGDKYIYNLAECRHEHQVNGTTFNGPNVPKYYAIVWIMRIA